MAKRKRDGGETPEPPEMNRWIGLGVAAGVGSAAIAAALLYTNRVKKKDGTGRDRSK